MFGIDSPGEGRNETVTIVSAQLRTIRWLTLLFIFGLFLSGLTAIPLESELNLLMHWLAPNPDQPQTAIVAWVLKIQTALADTARSHPVLFYGTDWLAFGHFMIAIAFLGALLDPIRNRWLYDFGLLACLCVIPYAMIFGGIRGIPFWWRLIDCSFGVLGAVPLWWCRKWAVALERTHGLNKANPIYFNSIQSKPTEPCSTVNLS
jgi:hypothetical protein